MVTPKDEAPNVPKAQATSLTLRIALLLTLALFPLVVLAVMQGVAAYDSARDTYRERLITQTVQAAQPETDAILRAFGKARGLAAAVPGLVQDPAACIRTMQRLVRTYQIINFAGFIGTDQVSRCNNFAEPFDFSSDPRIDAVYAAGVADVAFNPSGDASGQAVVIVSEPSHARDGSLSGFVSLSFPVTPLVEARARVDADDALSLITFNGSGEVLTAGKEPDDVQRMLPANFRLDALVGVDQRFFSATSSDGNKRDFALVPIMSGRAYALGIWPQPGLRDADVPMILRAAGFPLLMWLASVLVAVVVLRNQVIAPVRALMKRMRSFADSHRVFRAKSIANAPRELQQIAMTFERVTDKVIRDEADLQDKVHERDILLREVHHRVKNNLQMMSSIISMQLRQDLGAQTKDALRQIQRRLASLAKLHHDLYETTSLTKLRADQLVEDLARQTIDLGADPHRQVDLHVDLRVDLEQITLPPDETGALAMLVAEALSHVLERTSASSEASVQIDLSMKRVRVDGLDRIILRVESSRADPPAKFSADDLGTRLIAAFATQLDGRVSQDQTGDGLAVEISFPEPA